MYCAGWIGCIAGYSGNAEAEWAVEASDTNVSNFMRWAKPRTMLARYKQTSIEQTDRAILEKHPFVKIWEEVMPYLFELNCSYRLMNDNMCYGQSGEAIGCPGVNRLYWQADT